MKDSIPINLTMNDIASLCDKALELIDKLVRCKICPEYIWRPEMSQPRWHPNTIGEWLRIFDQIDLDTLPEDPPPLERPSEIFQPKGPTAKELKIFRRILGPKGQKGQGIERSVQC